MVEQAIKIRDEIEKKYKIDSGRLNDIFVGLGCKYTSWSQADIDIGKRLLDDEEYFVMAKLKWG